MKNAFKALLVLIGVLFVILIIINIVLILIPILIIVAIISGIISWTKFKKKPKDYIDVKYRKK